MHDHPRTMMPDGNVPTFALFTGGNISPDDHAVSSHRPGRKRPKPTQLNCFHHARCPWVSEDVLQTFCTAASVSCGFDNPQTPRKRPQFDVCDPWTWPSIHGKPTWQALASPTGSLRLSDECGSKVATQQTFPTSGVCFQVTFCGFHQGTISYILTTTTNFPAMTTFNIYVYTRRIRTMRHTCMHACMCPKRSGRWQKVSLTSPAAPTREPGMDACNVSSARKLI